MVEFNSARWLAAVALAASIPLVLLSRRRLARGRSGGWRLRQADSGPALAPDQGMAPPEALQRWRAAIRQAQGSVE